MKKPVFTGAAVAIITPMNADGSVNFEELGRIIDDQIAHGTDAIVICGTTGESPTLSDEEHTACIRYAVKQAAGRVPVIAGTGSNDTKYAIWLSQQAQADGADALLLVTPYYNKTSQAGLVAHYTAIANAVNLPCILYNVPSRTGCNLTPASLAQLAKLPNINAVKEASGNISQVAEIAAACGTELNIYSGNDDQIVPLLALGGKGVISVLSNMAPQYGVMPTPTLQQIAYHNAIWVHAASVGEVVAASPIVRELKKKYPDEMVVVSVVTATGHRMAQRIIPEADGHIFFPFDLPVITERIVDIVNPKAIILIETELWPNFLRLAFRKKIPVMMMNGRISSRSMRRYSLIKRFTTRMLCQIRRFCMQSRIDEERIIAMGAQPKRCTITGNTKYDQTYAEVSEEERAALRKEFRFNGKGPIIVAGSTHSGEEEIVLRTFGEILKKYPKARLLLAVREITRAPSVKFAIKHHGYSVLRRSKMGTEEDDGTSPQVVILDTIGELGRLYSLADVVFIGGSFVKVGGHNILEPAAHGKPVIVGPYMFNFQEIFELLESRGVCLMTKSEHEFKETLMDLLSHPDTMKRMGEAALTVVHENQGATERNIKAFEQLVAEAGVKLGGRHES